jgi:hypothetical protein
MVLGNKVLATFSSPVSQLKMRTAEPESNQQPTSQSYKNTYITMVPVDQSPPCFLRIIR